MFEWVAEGSSCQDLEHAWVQVFRSAGLGAFIHFPTLWEAFSIQFTLNVAKAKVDAGLRWPKKNQRHMKLIQTA